MKDVEFIGKSVGRCAMEYVRKDLDQILPLYKSFVYRNQDSGMATKMEIRHADLQSTVFTTRLGYRTYGVESDGTLTLLASYIDSSD